jgi:cell pole-organizing protein PopZ
MSDAKGQHEPSMEEILASIRRIIAEDGDPPAPAAAPNAPMSLRPSVPRQEEILELTEVVNEDGVVNGGPKIPADEPETLELEPEPQPQPHDDGESDRLVSGATAAASVAALTQLVGAGPRERGNGDIPLGALGRTLEDVVRELLRPLLKTWLDDNLPQLVERLVQEEIARMVREARGR